MIFHLSISAKEPERVARVMAELWRGEAFPFHGFRNSWITLAGDPHGTALEVYPLGAELTAGEVMVSSRRNPAPSDNAATHFATATPLSEEAVKAIGEREGWMTRRCDRGPFELIEFWVENRLLIELLTPEMARSYRESMTVENWRQWQ